MEFSVAFFGDFFAKKEKKTGLISAMPLLNPLEGFETPKCLLKRLDSPISLVNYYY